jgi:hypothetical protein
VSISPIHLAICTAGAATVWSSPPRTADKRRQILARCFGSLDLYRSARIDPLNPEAVRDLERTICLDPAAAERDPTEAVRANHSATRG